MMNFAPNDTFSMVAMAYLSNEVVKGSCALWNDIAGVEASAFVFKVIFVVVVALRG
jgi:hypothetical protein